MNQKIQLLKRGLKHPSLVLGLIDRKLKLTKAGKVSHEGERLVVKDWDSAEKSNSFVVLAHVHRYLWVQDYLDGGICLDAGCGSGYGTNHLAEKCKMEKIIGIDIDEQAIAYCQKKFQKPCLEFKQMDVTQMNFPDNYSDNIISFDVLEHLDQNGQDKFLHEVARVLKPSGTAYIGCPNGKKIANWKPNKFHLNELTQSQFEEELAKSFGEVKVLGQDILLNGVRQQEKQDRDIPDLSISNFTIVEDEYFWGLLSICKHPKKKA